MTAEVRARLKEAFLMVTQKCVGLSECEVPSFLKNLEQEIRRFRESYERMGSSDSVSSGDQGHR